MGVLVGCNGGGGSGTLITATEPGCVAVANLAASTSFPVANTTITLAKFNASGTTTANNVALPDHCQIQGIAGAFKGTDGVSYGASFELRLPLNWNGRFMFQGGGGLEGSVPAATGAAGSLSPTLAMGWAVVSQDGGHENSALTAAGKSTLDFLLEPTAFAEFATGSIDKTTQTAKFLINTFYGRPPDRSYHVGCSQGGRQGMEFSQKFPSYFDGIVAGDPVHEIVALTQGETNALQATAAIVPKDASGNALFVQSFSVAEQDLFTSAILDACDALDGAVDGIIDNLPACSFFDPATYVFKATGQPLQCAGAKTATCLSADQVGAIKRINLGPRTSAGLPIVVPSGTKVEGYPYDGGFMAPSGIPSRDIGTATAAPGNIGLGTNQIGYYITPKVPSLVPYKTWNFDTDPAKLDKGNVPLNMYLAISPDLSAFKNRGGKIIWYHGASDPGPSVQYTINYFNSIASLNGTAQSFGKLYLVPNMGHCSGGPAPDQFDLLTPLVNWVEKGVAPDTVVASGTAFKTAPTTRTHPLCAYPKVAKYTGAAGGDIGNASNFTCS
jgi:feruloyl esterase